LRVIPRRPILLMLALLIGVAGCQSDGASHAQSSKSVRSTNAARPTHATTRRARVLFIGDSILDQEGSAAAFVLRQSGVDARAIAVWGSGLIGIDAYDYGKTKLSGYWFRRAKKEVSAFDPDAIGVHLNYAYWPPYPHDAAGHRITDLWSASGQTMIAQQARALITILRARHAKVFFITPAPTATTGNPDLAASNPVWHGYLPVLRAMHVIIADTARPLEAENGLRSETEPSCTGTPQRVRPPGDVHLTRFGAGLAGSALAVFVAHLVHASLRGNAAPGDAVAALVPTPTGRGYWLVGCDGSVFHFGDATSLGGVRAVMAHHDGAATALPAPKEHGFWVVASDGTIASAGGAPPLALTARPRGPIVGAAAPDGKGLWVVTAAGGVSTTGGVPAYRGDRVDGNVVGIAATPDGRGYWLANRDGDVFAFGDARRSGPAHPAHLTTTIVGLAATSDGRGYWLVGSDGSVIALGDAHYEGNGIWQRPAGARGDDTSPPGPTLGIVAARGKNQGYWIFGTTGRVVARGAAAGYGGDNNLALLTQ
jgi:hypothetical protein